MAIINYEVLSDIVSSASASYFACFIKLYIHTQNTYKHTYQTECLKFFPNYLCNFLLDILFGDIFINISTEVH